MHIYGSLTELIGNTPMLELKKFGKKEELKAKIIAKLEYFNPAGSIKDRVGYAMIKDAEDRGIINHETLLIEPTSGNTGIGLAFVAAALGYKLVITLPENFSIERKKLMKLFGVQLITTPAEEGMAGAIQKAEQIAMETPNSYILQQFKNPANPEAHKKATAEEIWRDTDGNVDIFIAGVGSGGTISGVGEFLKSRKLEVQVIAVEPASSPVLSGGTRGPHDIQGIGAGFIPENFNYDVVDEIFNVTSEDAIETSKKLAASEGLVVGISSGATAFAAVEIAKRPENVGKNIVVIFADTGERYITTSLFEQ